MNMVVPLKIDLKFIDAVVRAIGYNKVGIRFAPWGTFGDMSGSTDPLILSQYAHDIGELKKRGKIGQRLAYIPLIGNRVTNAFLPENGGMDQTVDNSFAYSVWKRPIIHAGNLALHPEIVKTIVKNDKSSVVFGRLWTANPDMVTRLEKGLPLNKYNRDTFYVMSENGYTDYPDYESALKLGYDKNSSSTVFKYITFFYTLYLYYFVILKLFHYIILSLFLFHTASNLFHCMACSLSFA